MERFEDFEYELKDEEYNEGFVIDDAKKADWAISKIAEERKRRDFFVNCAKEEIKKLEWMVSPEGNKGQNLKNSRVMKSAGKKSEKGLVRKV